LALTDFFKSKIAQYLVNKSINNQTIDERAYSSLLKNSYSFLVMMPNEEVDFHHSIYVIEYLNKESKHVTIMTRDYRVSLINPKLRPNIIEYEIRDISKIKLPTKKLISKLSEKNFDVVIDLNRKENLFYSYAVSQAKSQLKIGFEKKGSDKFYNFQVSYKGKEPEEAYKYLVNCLQMF
jgi:Family of unknown function (DUF6913)